MIHVKTENTEQGERQTKQRKKMGALREREGERVELWKEAWVGTRVEKRQRGVN